MVSAALGPVSSDWTANIGAALKGLIDTARAAGKNTELRVLEQALEALSSFSLSKERSNELLEQLDNILPGELSLNDEISSRELLLVENLVRQIPEVRKPTVERLKQEQMWSLDKLQTLELSQAAKISGVDSQCLARIRDLVKEHLERRKQWHPAPDSRAFQETLKDSLAALERFESDFEAADRDEDRELKRQAREARRQATLRVNLMLVESGDLETLATVERMSVSDRIHHLRVANGER